MKRLLLVDGSSYLYRAFHAMPDLRNRAGEPTGAVYGMVNMLKRLRSDYSKSGLSVDAMACIFDAPGKTFRDDMYEQYKANRASMPEDLRAQIPVIHEVVRALGWPLLMIEGIEADDVIGTLSVQAVRDGFDEVVISTGDKDLAQLVNDKVSLVNTMTNERLDIAGVVNKFGVPPERIVDYLTLVGDTVDNVPGVEKVGPKTAVKWLTAHGDLDTLIAQAPSVTGAVGENLRKALDWLPTARTLVTVKVDCDLSAHMPGGLPDLHAQPENREALLDVYRRCEFKTWFAALGGVQEVSVPPAPVAAGPQGDLFGEQATPAPAAPAKAVPTAYFAGETTLFESPPSTAASMERVCVDTWDTFDALLTELNAAALTAFDTETTSLDAMQAHLVGLAFSASAGRGYYLPLAHRGGDLPRQLPMGEVLEKLRPWFEDPTRAKLAQHAKYDWHVMKNMGVDVQGIVHDTLLESYVLEAHKAHGMDALALRWLNHHTIKYEEVAGKGASQVGFDEVPVAQATDYSAEDAEVTLRLHQAIYPKLLEAGRVREVYENIELPVSFVLGRIERNGVLLDAEKLSAQSHALGKRLLEIEQQAYELAGQPFNLNSPKQIGEILFEKLKLPVVKKTASGAPSTDEEVLSKLAEDYPLPACLLNHRSLAKLKSTYTDKLPKMVNPRTGRVHTNYAQAVAVTGRLASNDPNLQNIPIRTPEGRKVREAFIAPPGHVIVSADYSQIELRIMAHISGDESLCTAFANGEDVHRATAAEIFGVTREEVTSEQRRTAKVINFGLIYGMSAFGLAGNLGIERNAAKLYIDRYFARYPKVAQYMENTRIQAKAQGFVETVFGRRLWLPEINSPNGPRRAGAERAAINAPMQGTAADLIKLAMISVQKWLDTEGLQTKMIMQVHDEIVLEVPNDELARVQSELPGLMTSVAQLNVPLEVSVGIGSNWDEAH